MLFFFLLPRFLMAPLFQCLRERDRSHAGGRALKRRKRGMQCRRKCACGGCVRNRRVVSGHGELQSHHHHQSPAFRRRTNAFRREACPTPLLRSYPTLCKRSGTFTPPCHLPRQAIDWLVSPRSESETTAGRRSHFSTSERKERSAASFRASKPKHQSPLHLATDPGFLYHVHVQREAE